MGLNLCHIVGATMTLILLASNDAYACQCANEGLSTEQKFESAKHVVRGKFVSLKAPINFAGPSSFKAASGFGSGRSASSVFHVDEVLKGELSGDEEVVTGFGIGDCGFAGGILGTIAYDQGIEIEIESQEVTPGNKLNLVSICGYVKQIPKTRTSEHSK